MLIFEQVIRSFDHTRGSIIKFYTPLTLIVGYNGSGKTTIIESLKYATTGEQPPNTKSGGAFIHDAKLVKENQVLAQVRLQFRSTNGAAMTIVRNLQLDVQKKGPPKQKTLEGNLSMSRHGERTSLSKRAVDLDKVLPQYLGVSKAVLDSVIFCHQDESLWPLSEPAALKKRFDEIFEAQKYTKAVTNIKDLRKRQGEILRDLNKDEVQCKENKVRADRLQKELDKLTAEVDDLNVEVDGLKRQAKEADAKSRDRRARTQGYYAIVESLKAKRKEQEWQEKVVNELERTITVRSESDEWLQDELEQYDQRIAVQTERRQKQANMYDKLNGKVKAATDRLRAKDLERGKYEQQEADYGNQVKDRKVLIKDTARSHKVPGYDDHLDDAQIREFANRLSKLHQDRSTAMDRAQREADSESQKVVDALGILRSRQSTSGAEKHSIKQQISSNDRKITAHRTQGEGIKVDEGNKALLEYSVEDVDGRLKLAKDGRSQASWDRKLDEVNAQSSSIENECEQLDREMAEANRKAGELAEVEVLKKQTDEKQTKLDTMSRAYDARLRDIVGQEWSPATLENDYQDLVHERSKKVKDAETQRNTVTTREQQVVMKLDNLRSDLERGEKELEGCAARIRESFVADSGDVDPQSFPQALERLQEERDIVKSDLDSFAFENDYFSKCLKTLNNKHMCRTCERPFHKTEEKTRLLKKLNDALNRDKKEVEDDFERLESELERAKEASSPHNTWTRLSNTDLPNFQSQIKQFEKARNGILAEVEGHDRTVDDQEQRQKEAATISGPVRNIVKAFQDLASLRTQAKELALKKKDAGLSRSSDEIQKELDSRRQKLKSLRADIKKLSAERDKANLQINALEIELSETKSELHSAKHQLERKTGIEREIEELQQSIREQRETMKRLDAETRDLGPEITEEETKLANIKRRGFEQLEELRQQVSQLRDSINELNNAARKIDAYISEGGPTRISRCAKEIEAIQQETTEVKEEQKQITKEIYRLDQELNNQQTNKRNIADNIKYRESKRDIADSRNEIAKLSAQNAEATVAQLEKEAYHWEQQRNKFSSLHAGRLSRMTTLEEEVTRKLAEYEIDCKDAARKYKEVHIKVETTKAAMEDLKRYMEALDKAITKYHSLKMEEINRIVEELWRRTYQGTDVDSIKICADNEGLKGNRTTNYRVVMIKQDIEMDMRGRCSAGQKVLASIIIRLALAECFGVNCGLIALDEPTTNLDRDNIRSLAESLHDIIRARQQQANFQLIVITHDEEFLRFMKCADFCDYYFRVSRDGRENSKIERQSIAEVY